ncbi:MAG TPA: sialidase family protein [Opitutaceae bacterium]|nr:sialidase family protein [Opitutaceae bacterium]
MKLLRLFLALAAVIAGMLPHGTASSAANPPSPAGPGSLAPSLATAPDGSALLSWLEPAGADRWALKLSRLDAAARTWSAPVEIARGSDWFVNWADCPTVAPLSESHLMAVWFIENPASGAAHGHHGAGYHAVYSLSDDGGASWTPPQAMTGESRSTEFTAVLPLGENSRALAAWLDGRARAGGPAGADQQTLYAQTFLADGPDQLVDPRVCDCCQLSLARVPRGALLAYRGRTADEVRDIRIARWRDGRWEAPQPLHDDGWKIAACPVNGPRLAARGEQVVAAWFTAAQDRPRIQVKFSRDAGATWSDPVRIDRGRPQGRVDCLLRDDGTALVTWLELEGAAESRAGGIYLQVAAADGPRGEPRLLAATKTTRASGFPRMAALPDGRVLLAYTVDEQLSRVATLLLDPR